MAKGAGVLFENPLMSFLWMLPEIMRLIALEGMAFIRSDYCMSGTAYQKPGAFLGTSSKLGGIAKVCTHVGRHPERLEGSRTRQSSPYPRPLVLGMVEGWIAMLNEIGGLIQSSTRAQAQALLKVLQTRHKGREERPRFHKLYAIANYRLSQLRH